MAFEGLVQWTQAVVMQSARVSAAGTLHLEFGIGSLPMRRRAILNFHSECHFFVVAANKLLEFREWVLKFGLCNSVDFSEIDQFPAQEVRDLRNMREHIVEYFQGSGHARNRWFVETVDFKADASSVVGNLIGGRLDWLLFGAAAERLLINLLEEAIPYPMQQ